MDILRGKGVLTTLQKQILDSLRQIPDVSLFYLTGGTALAEFYLGHRRSYDLDLFTSEKDLVLPFSREVEERLRAQRYVLKVIRRFQAFAEFELGEGQESVRVQLAYDSPFRLAEPVESVLGIKVNDYRDIVVDKLLAFFGRAEPRDAVDLFFILKQESLEELIQDAREKDPGFDLYWFSVALRRVLDFPEDIGHWPVDMVLEVDAAEIKRAFSKMATKIMDQIRGSGCDNLL